MADEDDLGTASGVAGAGHLLGEVGTGVVSPEQLGVGSIEYRKAHRRIEPAVRVKGELGVDREPWGERMPRSLGDVAKSVEVRPGSVGVDVVRRHR